MERMAIRATVRYSSIAFIAYITGFAFSRLSYEPTAMIGGLWVVISGLIVSEPATVQESISTAKNQDYRFRNWLCLCCNLPAVIHI